MMRGIAWATVLGVLVAAGGYAAIYSPWRTSIDAWLGAPDRTYEHAPRAQQLAEVGLTGPGIAARVRALAAEESLTPS